MGEMEIEKDGKETGRQTLASVIQEKLREEILNGDIKPNTKLNIRDLCDRFGSALSPVREALNRLAPEGLVRQLDRRGFVVSSVSVDEIRDLTLARCWLNEIALRDAITLGDAAWEEGLVVAHHRLSRTARGDDDEEMQRIWSPLHRDFHKALIAACRSQWVLNYCDEMFTASERYRHIARRSGQRPLDIDSHRPILDAALNREADKAVGLLNEHFQRTADLVEQVFAVRSGPPTKRE